MEEAGLCPDWVKSAGALRLTGGIAVQVGEDRELARRGSDSAKVESCEARHVIRGASGRVRVGAGYLEAICARSAEERGAAGQGVLASHGKASGPRIDDKLIHHSLRLLIRAEG